MTAASRGRKMDAVARGGQTVRFDSLDTPLGPVFVGLSERGVCDVSIGETSEERYRARLLRRASDVRRDRRAAAAVLAEIEAYFAGRRTSFSAPVDLRGATAFTARVLQAAQRIPFGQVASYGDLAGRIGAPRAGRAVGGALGRNPAPILVPCHRVVTSGRRLGGFSAGLDTKRALLQLEGHTVSAGAAATVRPSAGAGGSRA